VFLGEEKEGERGETILNSKIKMDTGLEMASAKTNF
jgi:hypothetical protein